MSKWISLLIMFLAVMPLPFINQIQSQRPLEFTPAFLGRVLGLSVGVMLLGVIVGYLLWILIRVVVGQERASKPHYFAAGTTVIVAGFLFVGNVGCITQPSRCGNPISGTLNPTAQSSHPSVSSKDIVGPKRETRGEPSQAAIDWLRESVTLEEKDKADHAGQLRIARAFVSREPTNDFAWSMLGATHERLGETEKALEAYSHAINLDPSAVAAWEGNGRVYAGMKQFDLAEKAFKRVTELKPDDADSWEKLGILYHLRGEKSLTVSVYQKLRSLDQQRAVKFFESHVAP